MTSSPLSEGPSPEGTARPLHERIYEGVRQHFKSRSGYPFGSGPQRKEQWWDWLAVFLQRECAETLAEAKRSAHLEDARALEQAAYAISEMERCLRAYITPIGGMGSNIQREDRGRAAQAFREAAKFREVWDALFLLPPKGTK